MSPVASTTFEPIVAIEDIGPCRKKITIEIPGDAVTSELGSSYEILSTQVAVPGFRHGKAPRKLVERKFGRLAREESRKRLVSDAYSKAVEQHGLRVLGEPEGGEQLEHAEVEPGKPISFTLEVEVAPEFALPSIEGIPVKKPLYEVTDEMVDEEIERWGIHEGGLESHDKAEPGDYCTGTGRILDADGSVVIEIEGAVIQSPTADKGGRGMIMGVMVDDFAKQLGSPKPGDTVRIKATGPEQHETARIRNQPITIEFDVARVDRIVPLTAAQLSDRLGIPDEARLREAITLRLNHRVMVRQQSAMRRQIAEHLLDAIDVDLPVKLTERQAERNIARRRYELMYRGYNAVQVEENIAEMRASSADVARRELKLFFILDKIAHDHNVQVTEGELNARVAQIAAERGESPEKMREQLIRSGQVNFLVQQVREHKAMDAALAKASIEEVPGDAYDAEHAPGSAVAPGKTPGKTPGKSPAKAAGKATVAAKKPDAAKPRKKK